MLFGKELAKVVSETVNSAKFRGQLKSVQLSWLESDGTQYCHEWVAPEANTNELIQRISQSFALEEVPDFEVAILNLQGSADAETGFCSCVIPLTVEYIEKEDKEVIEPVLEEVKEVSFCNCHGCKSSFDKSCLNKMNHHMRELREKENHETRNNILSYKFSKIVEKLKEFVDSLETFKKTVCK